MVICFPVVSIILVSKSWVWWEGRAWASLLQGLSPPGFPHPSSPHGSPLPFPSLSSSPFPLVPPPNLPLKQLTNLYALFLFVCLFVFLHAQDYFKLFEVAKERQLNCELWFVFLVGSRGCNIHVVSSHRRIHPCWHRTPNQLVLFLLPRPQAVSAF